MEPSTVKRWHRKGFKLYWKWVSRHRTKVGRKPLSKELRELIFRMVAENPTWGAPRIHGELTMLGFDVSGTLGEEGSEESRARKAMDGFSE